MLNLVKLWKCLLVSLWVLMTIHLLRMRARIAISKQVIGFAKENQMVGDDTYALMA